MSVVAPHPGVSIDRDRRATTDDPTIKRRVRPASTSGPTRPAWWSAVAIASIGLVASSYLFVTAPPPIDSPTGEPATVDIRAVFAMLEAENDAARAVWTEDIVEHGMEHGFSFGENWRDPSIDAGPLPALFLRETARHIERNAPGLRLFLGSRFPINTANRFTGAQDAKFGMLEQSGTPQYFLDSATRLETAMFADRAVAQACVKCHNEHKDSAKHDWQLGAIMGATTWMYPDAKITLRRATELVGALRASIRAAYRGYLEKARAFMRPPQIGARWPRDGRFLPDEQVFMAELARRTSDATLAGLLDPTTVPSEIVTTPTPARTADTTQVLAIRASRVTRVVVEHAGSRLFVARVPAGGSTTVRSPLPLRITVSDPGAVEVDYEGKRVRFTAPVVALDPNEDFAITVP